jgi:hypothetical protein
MYDIVIIGAGIAGLYSAYKIQKTHPHLKCIILEKESELGGRIHYEELNHEEMKEGGGFLRTIDIETIQLLNELHVPYYFTTHSIQYTFEPVDVMRMLKELNDLYYIIQPNPTITFKEYALSVWGETLYHKFISTTFYTEYIHNRAESVLTDIENIRYNLSGYKEGIVDWYKMIQVLTSCIIYPIIKKCSVTSITQDDVWHIKTLIGTIKTKRLILATNVTSAIKLLPTFHLLRYIHTSSSTKIFAKVDDSCIELMKKHVPIHTIVESILHNIMPIDPQNGIYLIGYSDEEQADKLSEYVYNSFQNRYKLARLMETSLLLPLHSLLITRIVGKYWPCAMHNIDYTVPCSDYSQFKHALQCPSRTLRIIGEMTAIDSGGWIGDAINSTDVITKKWLNQII